MPSNSFTALVIIGGILLLIGLLGGGVEIGHIKLPHLPGWQRALSGLIGVILIVLGLVLDPSARNPLSGSISVTPTATSVEVAQMPTERAIEATMTAEAKSASPTAIAVADLPTPIDTLSPATTNIHLPTATLTNTPMPPTDTPRLTATNTRLPTATSSPTLISPPIAGTTGPFREHKTTPIVGTGALERGTYSDGMATFGETDITSHLNIQRIWLPGNPDGCGIAFLDADKLWFGSSVQTALTINDSVVGTINGPTGKHGYVFDITIRRDDKICVTYFEPSGFHIVFGPDIYYHYDSYCHRGNC
jgi:hypothetical protein